jgi:hypothetical protein
MPTPRIDRHRVLGVAHILVGLLLLPLATVIGLVGVPLLALPSLWLMALGVHLWRGGPRVALALRRTHMVSLVIALLLGLSGVFALGAASRSAAAGGGLLGAFGILPIGLGLALGGLAVTSLRIASSRARDEKGEEG